MILVLLGPPGAGKGTQAARISKHFGLLHLSSGDILRAERKAQTELGAKAQHYMDRGLLVPDDLILAMMMDHIARPEAIKGALLDGFPRTLAQARDLDERLIEKRQKIDAVLSIKVPDDVATKRLTGRSTCPRCGRIYHDEFSSPKAADRCDDCGELLSRRKDDDVQVVKQRLRTYHDETSPLIAYYHQRGVLREVSGEGEVDGVTDSIKTVCQDL